MIVVLPREGETLDNVIRRFPHVPVREIFVALRESQTKFSDDPVDVYFPRLNVTSDQTLNKILMEVSKKTTFCNFLDETKHDREVLSIGELRD